MLTRNMLRHRVRIMENQPGRSAAGAATSNWVLREERWAAMLPQSGREWYAARQVNAETTQIIVFRGPVQLSPVDRIVAKGRWFDVLNVTDAEERGIEIRALCREGALPK